jgi:hypothetical protein
MVGEVMFFGSARLGYSRHKYHALLTSQAMTAHGKKFLMFDFDNRFVKKLI